MPVITLLLIVVMVVGFLQFISVVRGLFALFGRRWADAERFSRYTLLAVLLVYPLVGVGLFYAQLHWLATGTTMSRAESIARTISATMNFGVVGVLSVPLAAVTWVVALVARLRKIPDQSTRQP